LLPSGWLQWTFWQYSETGRVKGVNSSVDLDWFNGTIEELYQLAGSQLPGPSTYRVKQGDTLQSIADQYGLSLSELVSSNPQLIQPNMTLSIPVTSEGDSRSSTSDIAATDITPAGGTDSSTTPQRTYTVKSGDTLSGIALKYGTTYGAIAQINGIAPPYLIVPGQVLKIP
jgi:lysozyme